MLALVGEINTCCYCTPPLNVKQTLLGVFSALNINHVWWAESISRQVPAAPRHESPDKLRDKDLSLYCGTSAAVSLHWQQFISNRCLMSVAVSGSPCCLKSFFTEDVHNNHCGNRLARITTSRRGLWLEESTRSLWTATDNYDVIANTSAATGVYLGLNDKRHFKYTLTLSIFHLH